MSKRLIKLIFTGVVCTAMFLNMTFAAIDLEAKRVSNKLEVTFKVGKVTSLVSVTWDDDTTAPKSFDVVEGEEISLSIKATPKKPQNNIALVLQIAGDMDADVVIPGSVKIEANTYILERYNELRDLQQKDFIIKFNKEGDYTLSLFAVRLEQGEAIVTNDAELAAALGNGSIKTIWLADGNYTGGLDITRDNVVINSLNKEKANFAAGIKVSANNVTVDGLKINQTAIDNNSAGIYIAGDNIKISNCHISGDGNSSEKNNSGILISPGSNFNIFIENTGFKDLYRGIDLNGSTSNEGSILVANNNRFDNIGYGVSNTENCKLGSITGNVYNNCTEAFSLRSGVTSTVQGIDNIEELIDYLLDNNTFTDVTRHVVDYTTDSNGVVHTK